jgi:hypothetical protein
MSHYLSSLVPRDGRLNAATIVGFAILVLLVVALTAFVWWWIREAKKSRVASARMKAAGSELQDFFSEEAAKYQLADLYTAGPDASPVERAQHISDSSAQWANRLFAHYAGPGAELVYDRDRASWTAQLPLFEGGPLVAFSIEDIPVGEPVKALVAAVGLVTEEAPPVIGRSEHPSGVCVRYEEQAGRWEAFQPCDECGGAWLSMHFTNPGFASLARWTAQRFLLAGQDADDVESYGHWQPECARCRATEMRASDASCARPTCWYDTFTGQWMLSESLGEDDAAACVPIGLRTFFVNHHVVLAAANQHLDI